MGEDAVSIAKALLEIQAKQIRLEKTGQSNYGKHFTLDHVIDKIQPALSEAGLVVTQWPTEVNGFPALRTRLTHAESGETQEDTMLLILDKQNSQGQGSAITYARRYSLIAILNLAEDDDDGDKASDQGDTPAQTSSGAEKPTGPQKGLLTKLRGELTALRPGHPMLSRTVATKNEASVWIEEMIEAIKIAKEEPYSQDAAELPASAPMVPVPNGADEDIPF
jgi:hypothetical protein